MAGGSVSLAKENICAILVTSIAFTLKLFRPFDFSLCTLVRGDINSTLFQRNDCFFFETFLKHVLENMLLLTGFFPTFHFILTLLLDKYS